MSEFRTLRPQRCHKSSKVPEGALTELRECPTSSPVATEIAELQPCQMSGHWPSDPQNRGQVGRAVLEWTVPTLTSIHPGSARSVTRALAESIGAQGPEGQGDARAVKSQSHSLTLGLPPPCPSLSCRSYLCPVLSGWGRVGQAILRGQSCLLPGQLSVCTRAQRQLGHLAPCPGVPAAPVQWGGGPSRLRGLAGFSCFACVPPVTCCPLSGLFPCA